MVEKITFFILCSVSICAFFALAINRNVSILEILIALLGVILALVAVGIAANNGIL